VYENLWENDDAICQILRTLFNINKGWAGRRAKPKQGNTLANSTNADQTQKEKPRALAIAHAS